MIYIKHRVNWKDQLKGLDPSWGCEIDLRSSVKSKGSIHLSHDAWVEGESFEDWLKEFSRLKISGPLILNTKEDGLEERAFELMQQYQIKNFLFLDTQIPTLVKYVKKNLGQYFFMRLSSQEPIEMAEKFSNSVKWLWVDCFDKIPLEVSLAAEAAKNFKICLVSPELQGGQSSDFNKFKNLKNISQAICTKNPEEWSLLK